MTSGGDLPAAVDVVVVGAGLAGLSAATELQRADLKVLVLESSDAAGGRVRTDRIDGFQLDRGFQLLNPSYPRLRRLAEEGAIDLHRLELRSFDAGVRVALEGQAAILADPRRSPRDVLQLFARQTGSPAAKAAFALWALHCATAPVSRLLGGADQPYGQLLHRYRINGALRHAVLEPFLAGVLADTDAATSAHFVALLIRSFARGTPGVPAAGVQALPDQLVASLVPATVRLNIAVDRVETGRVHTAAGSVAARAVVIATDPRTAAELTGIPAPAMRSLTTFWFAADQPPLLRPILSVDGHRRGPLVNAAVLTQAAPSYSTDGRALIACTMVGTPAPGNGTASGQATDTEAAVRAQASSLYGQPTAAWQLLRVDAIADALPVMNPPLVLAKPAKIADRLFVAGDHRATASQQGALASGARAAVAVLTDLSSAITDQ